MKAKVGFVFCVGIILLLGLAAVGMAETNTMTWINPTTYADGTDIVPADQAKIKNYLRYKLVSDGAWTYFGETAGGKKTWTGTLPVAAGIAADYTVSAALTGQDGVELDSDMSPATRYTVPFPPGKKPGSPGAPTISRP